MKKAIKLNFTDYRIKGDVLVRDWYGCQGWLTMDSFSVDTLDLEKIKEGINDGGFGVERILSAIVDIYENYEGYEVFYESMEITL